MQTHIIAMGRRRKPQVVEAVPITGIADRGKSVGRDAEGRVIFVEGAVPGDVVDVLVYRKRKGFFMGRAQRFHKRSADRTEPFCQHFAFCGGCKWQHLDYRAQAAHKEQTVRDALQRIGKVEVPDFRPILRAPETTFYRNKLEFSFSEKRWLSREEIEGGVSNRQPVLGFHPPGAFDKVVDIEKCWLQPDPSNQIRNAARAIALEQGLPFFDIKANRGFLRTLLIRVTSLGEVLVVVSFYSDEADRIGRFLDALRERVEKIDALYYCINPKANDSLADLEMRHYAGKAQVEERLDHVRFRIGPKSFFQTNTQQAERLYRVVAEFAALTGPETVYDLYTGLGSIALYLARQARQVVGIEEVEAAIADARGNATLNGITNATFYAGDVKDVLDPEFAAQHGTPDLLVTDPPRAGMHPKVIDLLHTLAPPRMVYVSCNPATQARDLQLLSGDYAVLQAQPVDMFPHTHHVENVVLLARKASL